MFNCCMTNHDIDTVSLTEELTNSNKIYTNSVHLQTKTYYICTRQWKKTRKIKYHNKLIKFKIGYTLFSKQCWFRLQKII